MNLFKKIVTGFFVGVLFSIVVFIGNLFFPGKVFESSFTTIGLLTILIALGLDTIFNLSSVD